MVRIDVAGVGQINVVAAGAPERPPVVFIHPVGLDLTWWSSQIEAFSGRYRAVAYDLPGHGYSAIPEHGPHWGQFVSVLEAVIASVGERPAHIVGTSIGGMIAQAFALQRPDLTRSLTLVTTLCTMAEAGRIALRERVNVARMQGMTRIAELSVERWFPAAFRKARPDVVDRAIKNIAARERGHQAAIWTMIADLDFENDIVGITAPTLVVATDADPNVPIEACELIAAKIPGAKLAVLSGVGHLPSFEAPDLFNDTLRPFLDDIERRIREESL